VDQDPTTDQTATPVEPYAPGSAVPGSAVSGPQWLRTRVPVVFVPLGYGPKVAARAARLALLARTAEPDT
jgi:hypothetical protein